MAHRFVCPRPISNLKYTKRVWFIGNVHDYVHDIARNFPLWSINHRVVRIVIQREKPRD